MITRRRLLRAAAIAACATAGTCLYTWLWEPHWVEFAHRKLQLKNLPNRLKGDRLVQLSDLHIGPRVADSYLSRVFERVRELSPEFVVYTGDFVSHEPRGLGHAAEMIARLPLGSKATLGVLGNHDYGPGWSDTSVADEVALHANSAGIRILRNEVAVVDGLQVVGLDDLWAGRFDPEKALVQLRTDTASIALSHNPDTADKQSWGAFSGWILAGHTHGGQCKPPFLPPPLLPVENERYVSGEFVLSGGRRMYISRGVGHLLQVRFNARPEVTIFQLEQG